MYFKINKTGCHEYKGLVAVRFDLYLEENDDRYNEHHVQVPVIPDAGYPGDKNEAGIPVDMEDYKAWYDALPLVWQNNPFCCHFCQFESNVTDEEILYVGELALAFQYINWSVNQNLHIPINQPVVFSSDEEKNRVCKARTEQIIETDFTTVTVLSTVPYSVRE